MGRARGRARTEAHESALRFPEFCSGTGAAVGIDTDGEHDTGPEDSQ
jgi:hypothetical protein